MIDAEKKGPIAWMTQNSVAADILMILLAGGIFSANQVKQEFLPNAELDEVLLQFPIQELVLKRLNKE